MKHFVSLLDQIISIGEKEGLEEMFNMLLILRQQAYIRMKADEQLPPTLKVKTMCDCGKAVDSPYSPVNNFEYVGVDEENNPVFRCKDCNVDVWG